MVLEVSRPFGAFVFFESWVDLTHNSMGPSNEYGLSPFKEGEQIQYITFYEKHEDGTEVSGTTLEEMLRVSILRLKDLNCRFPCRENSLALTKMEEALLWLNERTRDRQSRGVEGQHAA